MIDPDEQQQQRLDNAMRRVLTQLALVSHGTTTSISPTAGSHTSTTRPGQAHPLPAGCNGAEHLYWHRVYVAQTSNRRRQQVLENAQQDLEHLTRRTHHPEQHTETRDETIRRMLRETEGWSPEDIEHSAWRIPARQVRRHRVTDGRNAETGKPTVVTHATDLEPAQRARELRSQGVSTRQIAHRLSVHQTQVMRWIRRA